MQKTINFFLVQCCFLFGSTVLFAQSHIVHGVVHAFDSIPLIGAEIYVKSSELSVITDQQGNFAVECNPKDRLKISAQGFSSKNVKISNKVRLVAINLKLNHKKGQPSEEMQQYAIGYGYVRERDRTTSVTTLSKNEAAFSRYNNIYEMIEGQFPGVEVRNQEIIIRGNTSFNSSSAALIVLDGVIVQSDMIRNLRPVEVKNINVIKDGSAAVYGSRGANGVVIIETRKGGDMPQ